MSIQYNIRAEKNGQPCKLSVDFIGIMMFCPGLKCELFYIPLRRISYLISDLCCLGGNFVPVNILHIAEQLVNGLCACPNPKNHSRLDLFEIFRFYGLT